DASRCGLNIEQPEFGNVIGGFHQKYGANRFAVSFGNPAALAFWIKILNEFGRDFRNERFKSFIVSVFLCVKRAMTIRNPTDVSGPVRSQDARNVLGWFAQQFFDLAHRLYQTVLLRSR